MFFLKTALSFSFLLLGCQQFDNQGQMAKEAMEKDLGSIQESSEEIRKKLSEIQSLSESLRAYSSVSILSDILMGRNKKRIRLLDEEIQELSELLEKNKKNIRQFKDDTSKKIQLMPSGVSQKLVQDDYKSKLKEIDFSSDNILSKMDTVSRDLAEVERSYNEAASFDNPLGLSSWLNLIVGGFTYAQKFKVNALVTQYEAMKHSYEFDQ